MSTRENKDVVQELLDAHAHFDEARVAEILSPRLAWHHPGAEKPMGREEYLAGLKMGHAAFPDMKATVDDIIAEDDRVAIRLTHRMTQTGPFLDIAPTGRAVTFVSIWFYRIVEGRVVEAWHVDEDFVSKLRGAQAGK